MRFYFYYFWDPGTRALLTQGLLHVHAIALEGFNKSLLQIVTFFPEQKKIVKNVILIRSGYVLSTNVVGLLRYAVRCGGKKAGTAATAITPAPVTGRN